MFRGPDEIALLVAKLEECGVSLWHACQLQDLQSYVRVGGIPSRSLLERERLPFTRLDTDPADRSRGMWPKVFAGLDDFGKAFASGVHAMPNVYGPIAFQIRPSALSRATDVAICLRSAAAHDFDRDTESLDSLDDIERLFRHGGSSSFPDQRLLLHGDPLRAAFSPRHPEAATPEVSLSVDRELIPLSAVIALWVDPIEIPGMTLPQVVTDVVHRAGVQLNIRPRFLEEDRKIVLEDVIRFLSEGNGPPVLRLLAGRHDMAPVTHDWATAILERHMDWLFLRYGRYLVEGTIRRVLVGDRPARTPIGIELVNTTDPN